MGWDADELAAQVADFERDGFLRLEGFLDAEQLEALRRELERFLREVAPRMPAEEVYREQPDEPASLKQLQQLGAHDGWFRAQQHSGPFVELARALLGGEVVPRNLQYFDKPAGLSRATPAHQDGAYFPIRPQRAVTLWLALDAVREEQGCVRYVRGSHARGLREHTPSETLGFSRHIADYEPEHEDELAQPCEAGDLLAHHSLCIHRCEPNRSRARQRRALGFIYYHADCEVDESADRSYQNTLAAKLRAAGRIT